MRSSNKTLTIVSCAGLCIGLAVAQLAWSQSAATSEPHKERARVVLSQELPTLDGAHLAVTLVEVDYGPGEASPPHSHPCAVIGYVAGGKIRSQVKGEPEKTYAAGETFYEPPNGVHLVSANASSTKRARLIAYLLCDHDAPLSVDVTEGSHTKGSPK